MRGKENAVNESEIGEFYDCFVLTEWLRTSFFFGCYIGLTDKDVGF